MRNLAIAISRGAYSAWIGAACLFVVITLQDVQSPDLSSIEKARIAVQRFPVYYQFAFGLLVVGFVLSFAGANSRRGRRSLLAQCLLALPLLVVTVDYFFIYLPLEEMTAATDDARPASFVSYHKASKWINAVQVLTTLVAAVVLCLPSDATTPQDSAAPASDTET